jgi:hypothetical protein
MHTPGSTTAGGAEVAVSLRRHHFTTSNVIAATPNAISATTNDISGAPPSCTMASSGPFVWLKPITPQGNPPKGTVDLSHSCVAHRAANQNAQPGTCRTKTAANPNSAGNSASIADNAIQGIGPTSPLIQGNSGR